MLSKNWKEREIASLQPIRTHRKSYLYAWLVAATILSSCDKNSSTPEKNSAPTPIVAAPWVNPMERKDDFCSDIKSEAFQQWVIWKIQQLQPYLPELPTLFNWIISQWKNITFYDQAGLIKYHNTLGISEQQTQQMIQGAWAFTSILHNGDIIIYLSPISLQNKSNFVEWLSNELLNAFLETQLPKRIEKKERKIDEKWGINITPQDIDGIGIEFTKELISGIVADMIREKSEWITKQYSLETIRKNLINGRFHETDPDGYAFDYFHRILVENWFPPLAPQDLLPFYKNILSTTWANISNNLSAMGHWLWLDIQP